ncbi:unnamed protein product [Brachionus calyciflorus]|uniref:Acrosin n=1 Tax=Brachionus calyciflorus TaxID=104777 RepID=A0A814LBG2_9BILA|nr:unnamed protein product [Brachionus calyciflorus]
MGYRESLIIGLTLFISLNTVYSQQTSCTLQAAVLNPGRNLIGEQANTGFCREWIVGPVTKAQRMIVSFSYVNIDCENDDQLYLYNENKSILLYDHCTQKFNKTTERNYAMASVKYFVARMQTNTNKYLSAIFDLILLDSPSLITLQEHSNIPLIKPPPKQSVEITNEQLCPSNSTIITEMSGTLNSPAFKSGYSYTADCSWIIRAPKNQRIYFVFDFINLGNIPGSELDQYGCSSNFISVASEQKPEEDYRLCQQRRGIKLITTYNNVLIKFVTKSLKDITAGFSIIYKIIKDPSSINPPPLTTNQPTASISVNEVILPSAPKCGHPLKKPLESLARIIGGEEAVPHSWPWQVMVTDGLIMCGATLINSQWLVTAAHCTENINSGPIKAYMGMHNRLRSETSKIVRLIDEIIIHPNYMGRLTQWDFDIALMKLQEPVEFTDEISPICLPAQNENFATLGAKGYVTGWGETQGTGPAYLLRQATITVKKNKECGASSDNMLCAGDKTPELHDSCQGDSGGPFFMKVKSNYFLVGIVSWGYDCNGAGVYTKVSNFVDWIHSVAFNNK